MNTWVIVLIIIILVVGGILIIQTVVPAAVQLNRDALAPVRGLVGNPSSATALAALL